MGGGDLWRLSGEELLGRLRELETRMRRDYASGLELVAELESRDAVAEWGYPSLPALLRDALRIGVGEAKRRVEQAVAVPARPVVSGGTVPAALPVTAAALRDGVVGSDHVEVIRAALTNLPPHVPDTDRNAAEETLVTAAHAMDARTLKRVADRVRAVLDQDGTPPDDRELAEPVNELHLTTRRNGRVTGRFDLASEPAATLLALLGPLARPRPGGDTGPDPRTRAERHGDALADILRLAADAGTAPTEAGERPHLTVTVGLRELRDGLGSALLGDGTDLDAASARRLACDSRIVPAVLGANSEPLDLGRSSYTVSTAVRRALVLRDRGCAFPGCDRPPRQCHAHHVRHWADGGTTDLGNLALLCGHHHRLVHHTDWQCRIVDGRVEFVPPSYVDPRLRPRSNLPLLT